MNMSVLLDRGGCANIFELPAGRVLKAFRRRSHTNDTVTEWTDHDAITRAQFRAEAQAYERLQAHAALEVYVPRYFGRVDPAQLLTLAPTDHTYVPGCGLVLEKIPGRASKFAYLDEATEVKVAAVVEQIRDALGLDQVWDGSCFVPGTRAPFTIIDFALWNAENYEMPLAAHGTLNSEQRTRLEQEHAG